MKIKTSMFYSLAALTLLSGVANAQTSSATDPVGFHTLTAFGNGGSGERYSLLSPGLVNPIEYASGTTSIDATTITVEGTPFAGEDYGTQNVGVASASGVEPEFNAYYVEITDGDEAGAWANITANTDNTLTVDRSLAAAGAAKIAIRKHVTIGDLFGAANEAGINPGPSAAAADVVSLFANGASDVLFYDNTAGFEGWTDPSFGVRVNTAIEPQQAVYVRRKIAGDVVFTRAGHVKVGPTKLGINSGFNALANPRAVGSDSADSPVFTLGTSNLYDTTDTVNSVQPGGDAVAADVVLIPSDATGLPDTYFYDDTAGFEGWTDALFSDTSNVVLDNGKGFLLNRKTGPAFVWTVPAETIAP